MPADIAIFGIGSANGADRAGWIIADELIRRNFGHGDAATRITIRRGEPRDLLSLVENCPDQLILIDAIIAEPGSINYIADVTELARSHTHSTHGIGVREAWELLEQLAETTPRLHILALGVAADSGIGITQPGLSAVQDSMPELIDCLHEIVQGAISSGDPDCGNATG